MKKLLYTAIVAFLFVGGLTAGVVYNAAKAQQTKPVATDAAPGEVPGLSLADLGATPESTPATESLSLDLSGASSETTPMEVAAAPTPEEIVDSGRSFGGGPNSDPVITSQPRSAKSSSASSGSSGWVESEYVPPEPRSASKASRSSGEIVTSESSVIEDPPPAWETKPKKGKSSAKSSAVSSAPVSSGDAFDEMPTVSDDPFAVADSGPASDPFASSGSAPTPDPFAAPAATPAPMVAMAMPSGGGDLVFGAASKRPALVKVAQKQNGASSVVSIELAGSARYKIIQIPKRRQVWVDFEATEVPGGSSSVGGSAAHVREISAKYFANDGGTPIARVIVQLDDSVVTTNDKGKEALTVQPAAGTGETSKLQLVIGAKQQSF